MTTFLQQHDVSTPSSADRRKSLSSPTSLAHRLLLFLAVMLMGVNCAWGQTTAVTFNNDVRYSQWIMDSRLPDFKGNTNQMGFPIYKTDGTVKTNASTWAKTDDKKNAKNDYVAGLVAKAAIENAIYYGAFDWSKSYYRAVEWYTQNIADVPTSGGSLDNLNPSKMFFGLYNAANGSFSGIANANTKSNAKNQLGNAIRGLAYYNTNYAFGTANYSIATVDDKDVTGGWFHKHESDAAKSYDNEMWCDGQYMGPALLAQLIANKSALGLDDNAVLDWNIVAKQFTITWNQLWNETDGLLYHAFTGDRATSISHGWSLDDGVYHSKAYWGRAVGWYMLGLVDVLEQMPSSNGYYATLKDYLNKLAAGVARYQTANGVWYQVMDEKNSALTGNYEEASCSAIFAAAYLKGTRLNLFTSNYQTVATNAYQGVISQFMKFDNSDKAKVHLVNSCASAGLGGSNKRSGERSYYITGPDVTKITSYTEGKPLGAFIMAATEYEQLYQNGQNLKFTSDLAPAYTCNGTTDALKAEAMGGNTTPTYQWYKDSQAVPSATSSSYVPTESGNYYCVATGMNTIQTSTAAVTVAAAPTPGSSLVIYNNNELITSTQKLDGSNSSNITVTYNLGGNIFDVYGKLRTSSTNITVDGQTYSAIRLASSATVKVTAPQGFEGTMKMYSTTNNDGTGVTSEDLTSGVASSSNSSARYFIVVVKDNSTPTTYAINCGSPANGTVTSSVANAAAGATVTLTISPSAGYKLSSISATDASSNNVDLSGSGTTRTFTMPASDVTVSASFVAMETSTATTVSGTTGSGTTLTAIPLASDATGQQTMTITKATGATYEIVSGSTTAANVSLDGTSLKYDAPAAGESKVITLRVTPEYGAAVDYTINVSTAAAAPTPTPGGETVIYSMTAPSAPKSELTTQTGSDVTATYVNGSGYVYNGKGSGATMVNSSGINIGGSSSSYYKLTINGGETIQEGDIITIKDKNGSEITTTDALKLNNAESAGSSYKFPYTVKSTDEKLIGKSVIYVHKGASSAFYTLTITRPVANVPVTGVTLNQTSATLSLGEEVTLTETVAPADATNKNVTWESSNTAVATVENGVVKAVGTGSATITVKTEDGAKTATCTIESILGKKDFSNEFAADTRTGDFVLTSGQSRRIQFTAHGDNATNVTWILNAFSGSNKAGEAFMALRADQWDNIGDANSTRKLSNTNWEQFRTDYSNGMDVDLYVTNSGKRLYVYGTMTAKTGSRTYKYTAETVEHNCGTAKLSLQAENSWIENLVIGDMVPAYPVTATAVNGTVAITNDNGMAVNSGTCFINGTALHLVATPTAEDPFNGWNDGDNNTSRDITVDAAKNLVATFGTVKSEITRFSPKGGTVMNTLYVGQGNNPTLYIAPFTGSEANLTKDDFEISTEPADVLSNVEIYSVTNGIVNSNCRQVVIKVTGAKAGTARVNVQFKGNTEFNPYPAYIDYTVTEPCVVTYNNNGGTTAAPTNSATVAVGGNVTAAEAGEMTKTGYEFVGWNTAADGSGTAYAPGDAITLEANVTLYAQWKNTAERVLYSYTVTDGQLAVTDAEAIGGTFTSTKKEDSQDYGIKLDFNNDATHYIKLNLNTALAAGDVIKLTMHQTSTSGPADKYGIGFADSPTAETNLHNFTIPTASGKNTVTYEYTVAAEGLVGLNELYLGRLNGNTGVYFEAVEIVRTVAAGTDASIKSVVMNNHNIPETNGTYSYFIGRLNGDWTLPVYITLSDPSATISTNAEGVIITDGTNGTKVLTANVGTEIPVTVTASDHTTTANYTINVGMAIDRPDSKDEKYEVENIYYYEGQMLQADGVDMYISLSAGSDDQLSFPISRVDNPVDDDYQYRIVNGSGASPVYDASTGVPSSGAYYLVRPSKSGMLTVAVQLNADKPLIISNGSKIFVAGTDFQYDLRSMSDGSTLTMSGNKVSENAIGTVTFSVSAKDYYIYAGGSKLALMGFGLDTTIPTYNVKAVATTGGGVSINNGAITSGTDVSAGTVIDIVATPNTGYKFTGWTNASGDIVSTLSTYHIDALNVAVDLTANFAATGIVTATATFPLDVMKQFGEGTNMTNTFYDTGNPTTTHVTLATSTTNVQAQNTSKGTKVRPEGSFTLTPATGMKIKSVEIITDQTQRHIECDADAEPSNDGSTWTYSMNADGTVTFTNPSNSGGNIYVTAINVTYEYQAGSEVKQYLGSFPANSAITDYVGKTAQLPAVNVTDDGIAVAAGNYTVTYESTNDAVATVSETGLVTLVGAGSASIKAIITPDDGSILGSTATAAVTSLALRAVNVSMSDLTVNSNDGEYTMPKPVVTIGSTTLAANEYTVSYAKKEGADVAAISGSQISLNGEAYNWNVGTEVVTVTVTPTVAARQQYNSEANGKTDFTITVVKAGAKTTPNIDFPDEITLNTNVTNNQIVAHVNYNGVDITSGFTLKYEIKSNDGSNATITDKDKLNTGANAGTAVITITATPTSDSEDQYTATTKDVTVHIKALTPMTVTPSLSNQSLNVGQTYTTPTLTVKANDIILDLGDEYTITYVSSAKAVASVDANGKVTALSEGTAVISVLVADANADAASKTYQDVILTYNVLVTDPTVMKVQTGKSGYNRGKVLTTGDGNLSVTLGGWIFPNSVNINKETYGTTTETLGTGDWGAASDKIGKTSTPKFKPEGFPGIVDYGSNKNPRNEYGNNSQPQSTSVYDATIIESDKVTLIDPMFAVPCSGSYLTFEPKTNGTISATIMQNGVFDVASGDPVYRPQRRVFVLDETGTLIQSTPKMEVTSGKFEKKPDDAKIDTKDFTKYGWDLNVQSGETYTKLDGTSKSGKPCTAKLVEAHFGISDFKSDDENFANGVYECLVDNNIVHNAAVEQGATFPGAKGWSVMVPAPVTYTFDVKAGKTYYLYNFGSKIGLFGFSFKEANSVVVDEVTLSQENAQPVKTQIGHVAKVNISDRAVKNNIWNAMVLPFSLNKQQVDAIFGHTYDKDHADGTQIVYFEDVDMEKSVIHFTRHAYNTIVAGKPFLIKPHRTDIGENETFTVNTADAAAFPYVTIEEEGTPALWGRNNGSGFMWRSSYSTVVGGIKQGDYYLNTSGDVSRRASASAVNIKGFRGWLQAQSKTASAKILTVGFDSFLDDDDDNIATDLNLIMDNDGNIVELPKNGIIYNMSGVVVSTDPSKLYNLPTGLYILNGKKYYVK